MTTAEHEETDRWDPEPRWPALIAIVAVAFLNLALPRSLVVGPRWLFLVLVAILLAPTVISHWKEYHLMNRIFGFLVSGVITVGMIASVVLLIYGLPSHLETPGQLLRSAAAL